MCLALIICCQCLCKFHTKNMYSKKFLLKTITTFILEKIMFLLALLVRQGITKMLFKFLIIWYENFGMTFLVNASHLKYILRLIGFQWYVYFLFVFTTTSVHRWFWHHGNNSVLWTSPTCWVFDEKHYCSVIILSSYPSA